MQDEEHSANMDRFDSLATFIQVKKDLNLIETYSDQSIYSAKIQTLERHGSHHFGETRNVSGANRALLPTHFF